MTMSTCISLRCFWNRFYKNLS